MIPEEFLLFSRRFKEALVLLQDNGTIIAANPATLRLFEKTENQFFNKKLAGFVLDPDEKIKRYLLLWKSSSEYLPGSFTVNNGNEDPATLTIEGCLLKPRTHKGPALILLRCFPKAKSIKSFSILNEKVQQLTKEIHERSIVEKGLRESEEKVRLLLHSTAEAIYGINNLGFCTFANNALLKMLGLESEKQLIGKQIHPLLHHSDSKGQRIPESLSPVYKAFKEKQDVYVDEAVIWKPDGCAIPVEYWARPIIDEGKPLGAVVTLIDITEKQQIRNALKALAQGTSGIMGNKFFEDSAKSLAEILDAKFALVGLIDQESKQTMETLALWKDGVLEPNCVLSLENTPCYQLLNGEQLYIPYGVMNNYPPDSAMQQYGVESYFGSPLIASNGSVLGIVAVLHTSPMALNERTESLMQVFAKRMAMELEQREITKALHEYQDHLESLVFQRTKELEQAYRDLESYSYSIAHDLRAPLRSITSFSQILRDELHGRLSVTETDYFDRVIKSSKFMAELISDILELSRITRRDIYKKDINLSEMFNMIIQEKIQALTDRSFQINVQSGIFTRGDPNLFYVMLDNLIENAIKFSQHKPETRIEFACHNNSDNRLICHIRDNGAGFNSEYKQKLFTPFQRLHKREEFDGTGIGLATVKRILERHQGDIWVEAEVEKGACFYFVCPDLQIKPAKLTQTLSDDPLKT